MSKVRALALYEFQPSADIELALKPGDIIVVNKKNAGDGWCEGEFNGKRGLFPKSFVRMITFGKQGDESDDDNEEESPDNPTPDTPSQSLTSSLTTPPANPSPSKTPLTPMSNKKMFMETLLTPTPDTIKKVYDREKVKELFTDDQESITIGTGPQWMNRPPDLTIVVQENAKGVRSSGIKLQKSYDVSTKELKVSVIRKYKHFLWLYDQLAEKFPCISLPPLPIKQAQAQLVKNGPGFVEAQRRGLERFLNRVGKHPVLGCTRLFHLFLTAIDEKEWRIGAGKHSTLIRSGGTRSKKVLSAPIYHSIQYPPYNVPINQLASFDKFSKFTNVLEVNLGNMQKACEALKNMHAQMSNCLRSFGKDIQNLAEGADQPSLGARYRKPSQGVVSLPNSHNILPLATTNTEEMDSEEDEGTGNEQVGEWNWRDDETFTQVMTKLHDLSSCIKQLSRRSRRHQGQLTKGVIEALEEYSSIVHTLPVLVKLHDDAMALYNESKQKGSKTEAEDVRQDCETLNNILLAEFDYFSHQLIDDLQKIILLLMKEEAEYHKKMAADWENLYTTYTENKPIRRTTLKRSTTLPGTVDDVITSTSPPVPNRPSSSDINKVDVSPSTSRRHYVNLSGKIPLTKKAGNGKEEPVYANLQIRKSEGDSTSPMYENWSPKPKLPLNGAGKGSGRSKLDPSQFNPSASLVLKKPIPPPLVVKRHELKSDQAEAERIGNKTDSFIVPTIPDEHSNYAFVTLGKPTNANKNKNTANESESSTFTHVSSRDLLSPTSNSSTEKEDEDDEGMSESRRSTLTPEDIKRNKTNGSSHKDINTIVSKTGKDDGGEGTELDSSLNSQTMSKLAKLTQLPAGHKDGSHTTNKTKKSFSYHNSGTMNVNKPQTTANRSKGSMKLHKITNNSVDKSSNSEHQSELVRKLSKQRQKVEKQLSCETDGLGDTQAGGLSRLADSLLSKDDLSKFGITEDETSGSFIV